ncbi:MAG: pseudouridine synthase [SAR324 cluster bacterium]|nr:pseudouridine synthase [SAR324 cluster bacterium]MCZ6532140.1 pseudouridine synthase [SAR324 cluster bacterium]MCZ6558976.1 pseudouridine synthase [SAR324 cluster bacterium]MCZ6628237.1 pseudouridine synthase [SAR324 cluster bacterium]
MSDKGTRIHKVIAAAGVASRREAERMILAGSVKVNGQVVHRPGASIVPGRDALEVEGRLLRWETPPEREVWALYKPKRCVTTLSDPQHRSTVKEFFPRTRARLIPVGRLDYDAEGLLLLTNDGELANRIAHPSYSVPKTYLVKVKEIVDKETLVKLRSGPTVDGRRRRPVKARVLHNLADKSWLEVVLKEGTQHHIKKMFAVLGHRVLKIKRYQIAQVALEDLQPGQSRRLSEVEIAGLLGNKPSPSKKRDGARAI